ncbi:MAG TPA: matrixin family metalloprotease [Candidatus Obscuribacterales bacterium]
MAAFFSGGDSAVFAQPGASLDAITAPSAAPNIAPASSNDQAQPPASLEKAAEIQPAASKGVLDAEPIDEKNQLSLIPLASEKPPRFVRIEAAGSEARSDDYLLDVFKATKNRVFRFKSMPIPVYITPYPDLGFTEACLRGFDEWETRSQGLVSFVQVDEPSKARVQVVWKHMGIDPNNVDCALGGHTITKWTMRPGASVLPVSTLGLPLILPKLGPKYSVPPQVIEVNLDLVNAREDDVRLIVLQNIVTHELGHAMGILGHSPLRTDMMYKETDECSRLSQRDMNTLFRLYQMKVTVPL